MAFANVIALVACLLLQPLSARSDLLSPLLSPIFDHVCKEVECGKGTCKPSKNSTFYFECECEPGWKQTPASNDEAGMKFLPCIVPNCLVFGEIVYDVEVSKSHKFVEIIHDKEGRKVNLWKIYQDEYHSRFNGTLNYSCSKAPSPVQENARKANESIFDVCHWVDCGAGSCNKTSLFSYSCECDAGYDNLLNITAFPCFRECALGMGCSDLGISLTNSSTSAPPALNDNSKNEASSILQGNSLWLVMLIMSMAKIQLQ